MIRRIRKWWRDQVWWWRFTHGRCTTCGRNAPRLGGVTTCRECFEAAHPWLAEQYHARKS